jgi:hypothetical protein
VSGDRGWAGSLRDACDRPAEAAAAWRAAGGRVVGVLGWSAPRELVTAAGMLPVHLSPCHLAVPGGPGGPSGKAGQDGAAAAFGRELTPGTTRLAAALLSGALDWIDFLLIGRDREDYTKLFYLLRELKRCGAAPGLIPVAFFDLLRLPTRTSARYNRQRAAELTTTIASWAGRPVTSADLAGAVEEAGAVAHSFRAIHALRARPHPTMTGSDVLAAAVAARVLPAATLRPLLDAALAASAPDACVQEIHVPHAPSPDAAAPPLPATDPFPPVARVFLAGSGVDNPAVYQQLEGLGLALVGEDHEWGCDGSEYPKPTRDPLDGIVDRYHFAHGGAARAGLRERVEHTAGKVRDAGAGGVLYLLGPADESAGWELQALRDRLGAGLPLVSARLPDRARPGDAAQAELREAASRLVRELGAAGAATRAQGQQREQQDRAREARDG